MKEAIISVNDLSVSTDTFLRYGRITGQLQELVNGVINTLLVEAGAKEAGITVSDEELQTEADRFRSQLGLYSAKETEGWLKTLDLTVDDLESFCNGTVLSSKLCRNLFADKAEEYFTVNKLNFDEAEVSQMVVAEESLAQELLLQLKEGESRFADLAKDYSLDKVNGRLGGYTGWVSRESLGPSFAGAIFSAVPGEIVGPVETDEGYHLVMVHDVKRAEFNDDILENVMKRLMNHWLDEQREKAVIKMGNEI